MYISIALRGIYDLNYYISFKNLKIYIPVFVETLFVMGLIAGLHLITAFNTFYKQKKELFSYL